ncbi:DUF998 domain-containing protein [Dactylosporangium sp. NBC_01737]|uniref:DUF998 domain-containing protein n=1 Tax=Dactylosporangium sp. NBC_01737 TaxID=2975959 RepID=UPI003FA3644E
MSGSRRRLRRPAGRAGTWGPLLVGALGVGLVVAGVFVTDAGPDSRRGHRRGHRGSAGTGGCTGWARRCRSTGWRSGAWCSRGGSPVTGSGAGRPSP